MCRKCEDVHNNMTFLNVPLNEEIRQSIRQSLDSPDRTKQPTTEETLELIRALSKKKTKGNAYLAATAVDLLFNGCDDLKK